jgi:hypothetical protein
VWRSPVPRHPWINPPPQIPRTPKAVPALRPPASVQLRVSFLILILILIVILISPSSSREKAEIKSKIAITIKSGS